MMAIPFSSFFRPYQNTTIAAGTTGRVFYGKVYKSCIGFLQTLGSNYYVGVKWNVIIDGEKIRIDEEKQLGEMPVGTLIEPPFLVRSGIEVTAENTSSYDLLLEVYVNGEVYPIKEIM